MPSGSVDDRKHAIVADQIITRVERAQLGQRAAEFLAQLRAVEDGLVAPDHSWIAVFPDYVGTPVPARGVDPEILRDVYSAIVERQGLTVTYQSLSRPEPTERVIEPHALAFDGFRWHARQSS